MIRTRRAPPPRWRHLVREHEEQRHPLAYVLAALAVLSCAVVLVLSFYAMYLEQTAPPRTGKMWTSRR